MNLDLEKLYSPSLYTKRFQNCVKPNEEVIKHFISASKQATRLARQTYKTHLDVRYGGENDNQLLDIYYKKQEEGTPIFVYIHGGFWQLLDKSTSGPLVYPLINHNYRIIVVDYNLCPHVTLKEITEQICNFYGWLKVYADKTKAPKISICGHSAGAHLAMQMLKDEFLLPLKRLQLLDQLYLISGLYDLRELWPLRSCNPDNILDLSAVKAEKLSPLCWSFNKDLLNQYQKQGVEFHILAAENDSECFKKQSQDLNKKLKEFGLNSVYKEFLQYDHFDIIEECVNQNSNISRYICENLKLLR